MTIHSYPGSIPRSSALMATALILNRTHCESYANYFLQEHGFADEVIAELLTGRVVTEDAPWRPQELP